MKTRKIVSPTNPKPGYRVYRLAGTPDLPGDLLAKFDAFCDQYHLDRASVLADFVETGVSSCLSDMHVRIDIVDRLHIKPGSKEERLADERREFLRGK